MSTSTNSALGIFADCITLLVKEHEPTKTVFELIRQRFLNFVEKLNEISAGEGSVSQTGSSFDDLHLSRLLASSSGKSVFYPPIDFDFMMSYVAYKILDKSTLQISTGEYDTDLKDLIKMSGEFAIMIPSQYPGYVKLLLTNKGRSVLASRKPRCKLEQYVTKEGFIPNMIFKAGIVPEQVDDTEILYERQKPTYTVSGPALSNTEHESDGFTYDFVHSFPCDAWPDIAINWTRRPRPGKWPTDVLIQDILQGGCAVVPVGHHLSDEFNLEWRVSFNAAERKLSKSLLPVQKSCYSLVKLMLKAGLSSSSILTSYHVKNMMFWFCEQMHGLGDWADEFLGERILQFIDYIANALVHNSIPSFFVPPNSLISHKSKEEIDQTRKEIEKVKENVFQTLALVCSKLQLFDTFGGLSNKPELQQMLTMYTVFVQTLYKLGMLNLSSDIAVRCFKNVVALNHSVKSFVKSASPAFSARSVSQLLKPIAIAYTQSGDVDSALRLYGIMLEIDENLVETNFPEVFTNLGCLFSFKYQDSTTENDSKSLHLKNAKENFERATRIMKDSASLHVAYGNFLLNIQSVKKAIREFEKAVAIDHPRADDEALVQIDIPGHGSQKTHVTGKMAALFLLCNCFSRLDDVYKARKCASDLEINLGTSCLNQKDSNSKLCAVAYRMCGLHEKSNLILNDSKKYANVNK